MYIPACALHNTHPQAEKPARPWASFSVEKKPSGTFNVLRLHAAVGHRGLVAMRPAPSSWDCKADAYHEAQEIRAWLRSTVPSETYRALRRILKAEEV